MPNSLRSPSRLGVIKKESEGYSVRFERVLNHSITEVWNAITDPKMLTLWLADVAIQLEERGDVEIRFRNSDYLIKGKITNIKHKELLEYTWDSQDSPLSLVRWELFSEGRSKCRLILTHKVVHSNMSSTAGGWHIHLDMLADVLDGLVSEFTWPGDTWRKANQKYAKMIKSR